MMVVPRQYGQTASRMNRSSEFSEKGSYQSTRSRSRSPRASSPLSSSLFRSRESSPTKGEPKPASLGLAPFKQEARDVPKIPQPTPLPKKEPKRRESVKDVLSATAIPIRRRQRGRASQRLPRVDHVANFSSLLMDDVKSGMGGSLPRSCSSSNFDGLFGNMDELLEDGQMYVGSEGVDSGILTTRSMSDDSIISSPSLDDYTTSDLNSQHSYNLQGFPERRLRQMATSEDCSDDHPLSLPKESDSVFGISATDPSYFPPTRRNFPDRNDARSKPSLKSSLTASLKALKSAAQSISNRPATDPTNTRARSFFEFHPELTDDRRPPPSFDEPTPELRRYLNPPSLDMAAQLHFWQDHRHSQFDGMPQKDSKKRLPKRKRSPLSKAALDVSNPFVKDLPAVVQLSDCLPGSVRTENASSPPIWLTLDGTPVNRNTAIPLLFDPNANDGKGEPVLFKHREPRENRDFLRVFVCEMEMRRAGKLSEDLSTGHARLWLPPVGAENGQIATPRKEGDTLMAPPEGRAKKKRAAKDRMRCLSIEDV